MKWPPREREHYGYLGHGAAVNEFHISMPAGLPPGKYQVGIFADNKSAGASEFTVDQASGEAGVVNIGAGMIVFPGMKE